MFGRVAIVGDGLVSGAWAVTFARAGVKVGFWDERAGAADAVLMTVRLLLDELAAQGLLRGQAPAEVFERITLSPSLEACLADAAYVQENVAEDVEAKRVIFAMLDRMAAPEVILASTSTAIRPSLFTEALPGRSRCLVVHPINPPYVIPAVEIVPAPWTAAETVEHTRAFMTAIGQTPLVMRREAEGFIINRLQAAVLQEAFRMVAEDIASVDDVDAGMRAGLGLRWALMGPFETMNLNAPGGLIDYASRYGDAMYRIAQTQVPPLRWDDELLGRVSKELDRRVPPEARADRRLWRDKRLMALVAHLDLAETTFGA